MRLFPEAVAEGNLRDGLWTGETWHDWLARHRREQPDRSALVDDPNRATFLSGRPRRLTWREFGEEVDRYVSVLHRRGVRADSIVGVQLPNCVELAVLFLAIAELGAIATPFPVQYRRHELSGMLSRAGAQVFVTASRFGDRNLADEARLLRQYVSTLHYVLAIGTAAGEGYEMVDDLLGSLTPADEDTATTYTASLQRHPNDCVTLVWTSGTEGVPKGVPRAYGDWEVLANACSESPGLTSDDVFLNPFPMVNGGGIAGMFLPWLALGTTMVLHQPFRLETFTQQVQDERVTYTCAPPPILDALARQEEGTGHDLSSLRVIGSGSAPLSGWMIEAWEKGRGVEVVNLFGSNEGGIMFADPDTVPDPSQRGRMYPRYGVPGTPWRHRVAAAMQARLVDIEDATEIREPGRPGELRMKGPTIFSGYWQQGRHGFDEDDWFCTGDVFQIVDDNHLEHVDRAKDIIIRGGYKISAVEVEALISDDPRVAEVAAVAMPDERLGEKVCVFVVPAEGADAPTLDDIQAHLIAANTARFKLPERLEIIESLPRNPIGKVLKRELRSRLAEPTAQGSRT